MKEKEKPLKTLHEEESTKLSRKSILSSPVTHFDVKGNSGVADVLEAMRGTGFQSRNLASCFDVLMRILTDKDRPIVMLGVAGAVVPGGLKKAIRDMVEMRIADVVVSTGANIYHDLLEALGFHHYLSSHHVSDTELRAREIDRIYDVLMDDRDFTESDAYVKRFAEGLDPRGYSTREFLYMLGRTIQNDGSALALAARMKVPIYCPAISDSSIGIGLAAYRIDCERKRLPYMTIDVIADNLEFMRINSQAKKTAAIFIGGGVPKNYIQQVSPMCRVVGMNVQGHSYGIQVTTDDPKWGGLSGCTFEESQSWGKYVGQASFRTVYMDATIAVPLLLRAVWERRDEWLPRPEPDLDWLFEKS